MVCLTFRNADMTSLIYICHTIRIDQTLRIVQSVRTAAAGEDGGAMSRDGDVGGGEMGVAAVVT
jgi:hypothetical protein